MSDRVLKFSAEWCAPCKQLKIALKNSDISVEIEEIDVDEYSDIAKTYGIRSIPTLVYLCDEVEVGRLLGVTDALTVKQWIAGL
jgi:thioredoxin 1